MMDIEIVGFRNPQDVRTCLSALANSIEKNFFVLVCENGGCASYRTLVATLNGVVEFEETAPPFSNTRIFGARSGRLASGGQRIRIYCATKNLGYAGGINLAISQIGPSEKWSALWILNPDTEPDPNALRALINRAGEGRFDLVSSRLVSKSTHRVQAYGSRWRPFIARGLNIGMNSLQDDVPDIERIERTMNYVSGASLFVTRKYIEDVGFMDERYFLYCEEVDWCLRGRPHQLGYAHDAIVYHAYGTTIGSHINIKRRSKLSVYLDQRNGLLLTRRFFPSHYPIAAAASLLFAFRYLRAGAIGSFLTALSGWLAGLRGEEGLPKQFYCELGKCSIDG